MNYVRDPSGIMSHLDGVPWWTKKIKWRWFPHRHIPQTVGVLNLETIYRCGCGAMRYPFGEYRGWLR